jgi:hypothetical protein
MILIGIVYLIGCVGATALIMHYSIIKPNPKSKCHKVKYKKNGSSNNRSNANRSTGNKNGN